MVTYNKKLLYIKLPENVQVNWGKDFIKVSGPLGTIIKKKENVNFMLKDSIIYMLTEESLAYFYWSLVRALIIGVLKGYRFRLKLIGVGYRARIENKNLYLKIGFSHEVLYNIPEDIEIKCSKVKGTLLWIKGKEEHRVRQIATEIRQLKKPDVYKGKGIHKENEILKLKKGKREGK